MKLVVIDYGAGNVASVINAISQIKDRIEVVLSNKIIDIKSASHLLLPGVSAFGETMRGLKIHGEVLSEIRGQVLVEKKPFLGICAGMQVLANFGFEDGEHSGLGFIDGLVEKIDESQVRVPHMGWNDISIKSSHPALKGINQGDHFYFANSYRFVCRNENNVLAGVDYEGIKISALVAKENILGAQFHPEKSGEVGIKFLKNFLDWRP